MDYQSAIDYVLSFSDYERWPGAGYAERWDLRRMDDLLARLELPHLGRRTVHIAGSKGKGSTSAMIASALGAAGFRTGLYTSPHLHTIRERIQVNGESVTEEAFAAAVDRMRPAIEETNRGRYGTLSTFEILTAVAFVHFRERGADFQVLETGLGGRLDATNVCRPEVCVITSISLDHTAVLGDTIAKIAAEKAGIIKPGVTVISAPQAPEAAEVIEEACRAKQARLVAVGRDIIWHELGFTDRGQSITVSGLRGRYEVSIPLLGGHQLANATTAVAALEALDISPHFIVAGLANVNWPGRMQVLRQEPLLIADGAHNVDSVRKLIEALQRHFQSRRRILIVGTSADKNSAGMVAELAASFDMVVATSAEHPRATPAAELAAEFARHGVSALVTESVAEAVEAALARADKGELICATGSLFVVAETIEHALGIEGERYPAVRPEPLPASRATL